MKNSIYVVSKVAHAGVWKGLRDRGYPIISTWIDDGTEPGIDFIEAWPRYLGEAAQASFVIVYVLPGEELKGGLVEIGAALANNAYVFIVGSCPSALRTVRHHPRVHQATSVGHALALMHEVTGVHIGKRTQTELADWVGRVFGQECLWDMKERSKRVGEESVELMQAVGIPKEEALKIVEYVYSRPPGVVEQELAGVGTTIQTACHAWGVGFEDVVDKELERVLSLPIEHFKNKHREKQRAGITHGADNLVDKWPERLHQLGCKELHLHLLPECCSVDCWCLVQKKINPICEVETLHPPETRHGG